MEKRANSQCRVSLRQLKCAGPRAFAGVCCAFPPEACAAMSLCARMLFGSITEELRLLLVFSSVAVRARQLQVNTRPNFEVS